MFYLFSAILIAAIIAPFVYVAFCGINGKRVKSVLKANIGLYFVTLVVATIWMFGGDALAAGDVVAAADASAAGLGYIAAAMVTGLACIGAGIAVAAASSAALGAISEDPKVMGKALIFVALAEGIALYGLLISFNILNKI